MSIQLIKFLEADSNIKTVHNLQVWRMSLFRAGRGACATRTKRWNDHVREIYSLERATASKQLDWSLLRLNAFCTLMIELAIGYKWKSTIFLWLVRVIIRWDFHIEIMFNLTVPYHTTQYAVHTQYAFI
jgi:hypothetical protein